MFRGILFDKDGTLIEFVSLWHDIVKNILETLKAEYGISENIIEELKKSSGYLEMGFEKESIIQYCSTQQVVTIWYEIIKKYSVEINCITQETLFKVFEKKSQDANLNFVPIEGVVECLEYLKEKGYFLGIATADTKQPTLNSLEKAGILDFFDYIGYSCDEVLAKPEADMAMDFYKAGNLHADEVLVVGDSITDMLFAQNAGATFAGILTDYNNFEQYTKSEVQIIHNITEIVEIFNL